MIRITETIKKIIKQKNAELVSGEDSISKLLYALQRQVTDELAHAAIGSWNAYSLTQLLDSIERKIADYDSAASSEIKKRVADMWDLGQASVYKPLEIGGIFTGFNLSTSTLQVLQKFAIKKISGVSSSLLSNIEAELHLGILGKSPQEVSKAIGVMLPEGPLVVKGRTIFTNAAQRSEFVTKTELGRVYSEAANVRAKAAARYVPDLEKVWQHGHPRTPRPTHLAADGISRPMDKPFPVRDKNGYQLMYPHDPNADFSEVAGCQCSQSVWIARWGKRPKAA